MFLGSHKKTIQSFLKRFSELFQGARALRLWILAESRQSWESNSNFNEPEFPNERVSSVWISTGRTVTVSKEHYPSKWAWNRINKIFSSGVHLSSNKFTNFQICLVIYRFPWTIYRQIPVSCGSPLQAIKMGEKHIYYTFTQVFNINIIYIHVSIRT